jgi:ATP-dependent 26S proteasome regulatory subunit
MTDQQIWTIVISGSAWLFTLVVAVWGAAWWFKSQVTSGEIRELKQTCNALDQRRLLAEDQQKIAANELATVKAQLVTAQDQLKAHASTEVISGTLKTIQSSTTAAITSNNEIGRMLRVEHHVDQDRLYPPTISLTKKSNE